MTRCTRKGCGQEYDEENNNTDSCLYHTGGPVFHEGLKSWSCCPDVNKPVLDFDEFMKIRGCMRGSHSNEASKIETPKSSSHSNLRMTESANGTEVYSSTIAKLSGSEDNMTALSCQAAVTPAVEEEDNLDVPVKPGTPCLRKGCGTVFVSNEASRMGDGPGTICTHHPLDPIFREGSKGYLCCKRRVLEFEEFLKIEGCKKGRHLFVTKGGTPAALELTTCRIDHYQTLTTVHVSVFARKADTARSAITFKESQIYIDLFFPGSKRFTRTLDLFGPIDTAASSFKILPTKVEVNLQKLDNRSWTVLEKPTRDLGNFSLTFGVGGRTGTIGAKEMFPGGR